MIPKWIQEAPVFRKDERRRRGVQEESEDEEDSEDESLEDTAGGSK